MPVGGCLTLPGGFRNPATEFVDLIFCLVEPVLEIIQVELDLDVLIKEFIVARGLSFGVASALPTQGLESQWTGSGLQSLDADAQACHYSHYFAVRWTH